MGHNTQTFKGRLNPFASWRHAININHSVHYHSSFLVTHMFRPALTCDSQAWTVQVTHRGRGRACISAAAAAATSAATWAGSVSQFGCIVQARGALRQTTAVVPYFINPCQYMNRGAFCLWRTPMELCTSKVALRDSVGEGAHESDIRQGLCHESGSTQSHVRKKANLFAHGGHISAAYAAI